MKIIKKFHDILPKYDLFIVDLWGVVHDGHHLYPNVKQTFKEIKKLNKKIVLLSNAPRRYFKATSVLDKLGITDDLYEDIITSGEVAFQYFEDLSIDDEPKKYFYLGPEKDRDLLEATLHREVSNPKNADFAIATGLDPHQKVSDVKKEINAIHKAGLTMHCVNPDKFVHKIDGSSHICAGAVADEYIKMGGEVAYYGKPYLKPYEMIMEQFNDVPKEKILCVGDGINTDIPGANNAKLDSVLISSGMHMPELKTKSGENPTEENVKKFLEQYDAVPTYVTALFGE